MLKFFPGDLVCRVNNAIPTHRFLKLGVVTGVDSRIVSVKFDNERKPVRIFDKDLWFVSKDAAGNTVAVKQRPPAPKDPPTPIPEKPFREEEPEEEEVKIMRSSPPKIPAEVPVVKTEVQKKVEALSAAGYDPFQIWQDMLRQAEDLGKTLVADQSAAVEKAHEAYLAAAEQVEQAQKLLDEYKATMELAKTVWTDAAEKLTLVSKRIGPAK